MNTLTVSYLLPFKGSVSHKVGVYYKKGDFFNLEDKGVAGKDAGRLCSS